MSIPTVAFETTLGKFVVELNAKKAPLTVANFLRYVKNGHYDGTIFHRVIADFMIQGGGYNEKMAEKTARERVNNEADNGLKNEAGTIAMARTQDPHSAGAQFFINVRDNDFLNHTSKTVQGWGYAVFGKVSEGMDVIKKIEASKTTRTGGHADVPVEHIIITKATVTSE